MNELKQIIVILVVLFSFPIVSEVQDTEKITLTQYHLPVNQAWPTKDEIKKYIILESDKHGINPVTALRIANCESGFDRTAKNPSSTAAGIYQFLDSTWNNYCIGNKLDSYASVDCFMKYYKQHKSWWVCK